MATRASIIFNFNKAKKQADELDAIANKMKKLSGGDFADTMQNISSNWKGENASAFLQKGAFVQEDMLSTANSLHGVASEIRSIARRIYTAEMKAIELAEKRDY